MSRKDKFADDVVADMTTIPDLDTEAEEKDDITDKIANAPNVRANKVQALADLDEGISRLPTGTVSVLRVNWLACADRFARAQVDGIDLSLLSSVLTPLEKLGKGAEQDMMWDFDNLFAELASEIQREQDGDREEGEADEGAFQFDTSYSRSSNFKEEKKGSAPMTS